MMTWLTRMSFLDTAADFDLELLAQQQYEARELLMAMAYDNSDVEIEDNHPILRMWLGYEIALAAYAQSMTLQLASIGYPFGTQGHQISSYVRELWSEGEEFTAPPWLADTDLLRSHRSNLARRYPDRFGSTWARTPTTMPYLWPFVDDQGGYALMVSKHDKALLTSGERTLPKSIANRVENL